MARDTLARLTPEELRAKANRKYGEGSLIKGDEILREALARVTSGSLAYDHALGGGWPLNQWNEIVGEESHGKTTMVFKTIAANQALDPDYYVLWVASEEFVEMWAESCGVDVSRVFIFYSNVMEDAYEVVLDWVTNQACDAVVIDSLANLVPGEEAEKAMAEFQVGLGARLTGKFSRKSGPAMRRSQLMEERNCLILIVNQFRMKIGSYGDPRTTPGGKAKDFAYFTRVEVKRDDWIKVSDSKPPVGLVIKGRVFKNKTAPSQRTAAVDFYFAQHGGFSAGSFDVGKDIALTSLAMDNVLTKRGAWIYFGEDRWQGAPDFIAAVREQPELQAALRVAVLLKPLDTPVEAPQEPVEPRRAPRAAAGARKAPLATADARRIKR